MLKQHADLLMAMVRFDDGDPGRIQHNVKVHNFAAMIGVLEGIPEETQFILETAAIVHDIGIRPSMKKYGSTSGTYQQIEGPGEADKMMRELGGYTEEQIERVKYLIAHHHTYDNIDGLDYQILVEADFLVNLHEDGSSKETVAHTCKKIFRTETGIKILREMFGIEEE